MCCCSANCCKLPGCIPAVIVIIIIIIIVINIIIIIVVVITIIVIIVVILRLWRLKKGWPGEDTESK